MNNITAAAALAMQLATDVLDKGNGSAVLCLSDSVALAGQENFLGCARRAIRSISHSVGIFHPHYAKAANALLEATDRSEPL